MKATIEFDLPEEREELEEWFESGRVRQALCEFFHYLRGQIKYVESSERDDAEGIYARLWRDAEEHDVDLWTL